MKNCNHLWITVLSYPHPTLFMKKVVLYKCAFCGEFRVVHKFKGIIDFNSNIKSAKVIKEKKLIKK